MTIYGDSIFTPRLKLRKLCNEDLPFLVVWSNSEPAHGPFLTPDRTGLLEWREKLASGAIWSDRNKLFVIELRDGTPLGTITYWLRPEKQSCAVIKVKISEPNLRGNGYGTESQKYLILNLFERFKVEEVEMYTDINNRIQQRCLAKLGFDLIESLTYDDRQVKRLGNLYRLSANRFKTCSLYHYHYE